MDIRQPLYQQTYYVVLWKGGRRRPQKIAFNQVSLLHVLFLRSKRGSEMPTDHVASLQDFFLSFLYFNALRVRLSALVFFVFIVYLYVWTFLLHTGRYAMAFVVHGMVQILFALWIGIIASKKQKKIGFVYNEEGGGGEKDTPSFFSRGEEIAQSESCGFWYRTLSLSLPKINSYTI